MATNQILAIVILLLLIIFVMILQHYETQRTLSRIIELLKNRRAPSAPAKEPTRR